MLITFKAKDFVEGAGSLYQKYLFTYMYALAMQEAYVHTSAHLFKAHYKDTDLKKVEELWRLIFYPITSCGKSYEMNEHKEAIKSIPFADSYQHIKNIKKQDREGLFKLVRGNFAKSFEENNLTPKLDEGNFTIAVHLRAFGTGDINFFKNYTYPWQYFNCNYGLSDNCPEYYGKLYSKAINAYINVVPRKKIIVHIHSTASKKDLSPLVERLDPRIEIQFCGEQLAPIAFLDMIHADILIASHSSFSWLALLLRHKPSRIRKGFRYILPENTTLLDEVLYDEVPLIKRPIVFLRKVFDYCFFYPEYFFNLIRSRIYF